MKRAPEEPGGDYRQTATPPDPEGRLPAIAASLTLPHRRVATIFSAIALSLAGTSCTDANGYARFDPERPDPKSVRFIRGECQKGNPDVESSSRKKITLACPQGGRVSDTVVSDRKPKDVSDGNTIRVVLDNPEVDLKPAKKGGAEVFVVTGEGLDLNRRPRRI